MSAPHTQRQTEALDSLKEAEADLAQLLHELGGTESGQRLASRNLSLAKTHFEDAFMRITRHYYRGDD